MVIPKKLLFLLVKLMQKTWLILLQADLKTKVSERF